MTGIETDDHQRGGDQESGEMARRAKRPRGGPPIDPEILAELGRRVIARTDELALTPAEVARVTGVSLSTIYNIRRGDENNPSLSVLIAISKALDVRLEWLVGNSARLPPQEAEVRIMGEADATAYRIAMKAIEKVVGQFVPKNERLAEGRRYAIEIKDNHLEGLNPPVMPGHVAYYVDFSEIDADVESGRAYLIYRKNEEGQIQTAFWRATVFRDRVEFAPASRDEAYNRRMAFTIPRDQLYTSENVKIAGLFYAAIFDYS